jgi:putative salt-induced outer membrane protein YdiY
MNNFIKKFTNFIQDNILLYQKFYLLENDPSKYRSLKDKSMESLIIFSKYDLYNLIESGYSLGEFQSLTDLTPKFFRSQILFGIFVNKILVNISLLIIKDMIEFHPPLKINFDDEAYIHYSITDPEYRGKGFYSYNLEKMSEFSAGIGKKKIKMAITKDNLYSLKAANNSGFKIIGEGKYLKILKYIYWKEKKL